MVLIKVEKPWQAICWVRTYSNKRFGEIYFLFLWNVATMLIKEARYSEEMTCRSNICFCGYSALPSRLGDLFQRTCSIFFQK